MKCQRGALDKQLRPHIGMRQATKQQLSMEMAPGAVEVSASFCVEVNYRRGNSARKLKKNLYPRDCLLGNERESAGQIRHEIACFHWLDDNVC